MKNLILNHFKRKDKILYSWALKFKGSIGEIKKDKPVNYFLHLCSEIVGQQLSGKVADVIFTRFKKLFSGKITPKKVFLMSHKKLRAVGLSNAKVRYVKYLAKAVLDKSLPLSRLDSMSDGGIRESLLAVKGIGPWTCEMFLMFTLARPDVFSFGDLGLKKGMMKVYKMKKEPTKEKMEKIVLKWSPYKSYAARVLWKSLDS